MGEVIHFMHMFFCVLYTISFILFFVYWRKKIAAKRAAGVNYKEDPLYRSMSKIKRFIGVVCILSLIMCILTDK